MNCERTRDLLNAYLDGELSPSRHAQVEEHLRVCASCAGSLDELRRLNRTVEAMAGRAVPEGFARRVRQAAEAQRVLRLEATARGPRVFGDALTRLAAVLMAVAGLSVGMALGGTLNGANGYAAQLASPEAEVLDLHVGSLSAAPEGSVSEVYLAFVSEGG